MLRLESLEFVEYFFGKAAAHALSIGCVRDSLGAGTQRLILEALAPLGLEGLAALVLALQDHELLDKGGVDVVLEA